MKAVNFLRTAAGCLLLAFGWVVFLWALTTLLPADSSWRLPDFLNRRVLGMYCGMLPLGLLRALLALPGGTPWPVRLRRAVGMKLLLSPFFLANFYIGLAGAAFFLFGGVVVMALAWVIAWAVLLAASADVLCALMLMRREGGLSAKKIAKHIVFQLIFCVDVIDAAVLWANRDKYVPRTEP